MQFKNSITHASIVCFLLIFFFNTTDIFGQTVEVEITDIRSGKGKIIIGVFRNQEQFKNENSILEVTISKEGMINGKVSTIIELPPGIYGISVLDDENGNGEMDYNFLGIPREGFGFSNYYHTALRRPVFENFKFELKKSQRKKIHVKMNYYL